ncbi:MAG: magnesium transporter CorA family protein [Dehalococcoidia bacterium]|nr:magnesium transporter CorA family protein [Dehalococcoidia bacterium]
MDTWSLVEGRWREGEQPGADIHWFDLVAERAELEALAPRFGLHPLAVEDCVSLLPHAPKIDDFSDHIFIVCQALEESEPEVRFEEVDIFLGKNFVITYRDRGVAELDAAKELLLKGVATRPGTDGLVYEILDRVVDAILPRVNDMAERIDAVHEEVLSGTSGGAETHSMVQLRANAGRVRRVLAQQLLVAQRLSRGEFGCVTEPNRVYFRDIYDHLVRIDLALEGVREDAEVALSTYMSALNNRLSEVMKVLSVVAALALPATVISGIFGTNFDNVPGLHSNWGFALMIAAMLGVAGGMGLYFRRRGWF